METTMNLNKMMEMYEKIIADKDAVNNMCISDNLKGKVYEDMQNQCVDLKQQMIAFINELPNVIVEIAKENTLPNIVVGNANAVEKNCKSIVSKSRKRRYSKNMVSKISEPEETDPFKKWKNEIKNRLEAIYDRSLKYYDTKDIIKEIYNYMNKNYGIVWEQAYKEWRRDHNTQPTTKEIIFNNAQFKSIFDAILNDKYINTIESKSDPYTVMEIVQPLVNLRGDKSPHGSSTTRIVYTEMEKRYGLDFKALERKYTLHTGKKLHQRQYMIYWDRELMVLFRKCVADMIAEL